MACGGVCIDWWSDVHNCGGCGIACDASGGESCAQGTCRPSSCAAWYQVYCGDGVCLDKEQLSYDPSNCGGCGIACATGQVCNGGKCVSPPCGDLIEQWLACGPDTTCEEEVYAIAATASPTTQQLFGAVVTCSTSACPSPCFEKHYFTTARCSTKYFACVEDY
jgi:hypothetical protein